MINKNDCLILLAQLNKDGIDTKEQTKNVLSGELLPALKFINDNRPLDITNFYKKIRKSYNSNRSKLYINIMKDLDETNIRDVITTLNSFALQANLFEPEDKTLFIKHARLDEIYKVLYKYAVDYDLTKCIELLRLIKADIKALESTYREKK